MPEVYRHPMDAPQTLHGHQKEPRIRLLPFEKMQFPTEIWNNPEKTYFLEFVVRFGKHLDGKFMEKICLKTP